MKQDLSIGKCSKQSRYNRYAYVLYMLLFIYLFIKGDYEFAFMNMGVALVFDPFDTKVKWHQRPFYQKAWLIGHLAITLSGIIYIYFHHH